MRACRDGCELGVRVAAILPFGLVELVQIATLAHALDLGAGVIRVAGGATSEAGGRPPQMIRSGHRSAPCG
jgi:hypothetical protein